MHEVAVVSEVELVVGLVDLELCRFRRASLICRVNVISVVSAAHFAHMAVSHDHEHCKLGEPS